MPEDEISMDDWAAAMQEQQDADERETNYSEFDVSYLLGRLPSSLELELNASGLLHDTSADGLAKSIKFAENYIQLKEEQHQASLRVDNAFLNGLKYSKKVVDSIKGWS